MMNTRSFVKSIASFAIAVASSATALAQVPTATPYSSNTVNSWQTCQANRNCSREQRAQIAAEQAKAQNNAAEYAKQNGFCSGATCTQAEIQSMQSQMRSDYEQQGEAALNQGGVLSQEQAAQSNQNALANGVGTSSKSGGNGQIIMLGAAGAAAASAAVFKTPCGMPTSSAWACPLMAMAVAQLITSGGQAAASGGSGAALQGSGVGGSGSGTNPLTLTGGANDNSGSGSSNGNGSTSLADAQIGQLSTAAAGFSKDLKDAGFSISEDGKTVTGPGGKKISTNAFSSPSSMSAAGFSDSQVSDAFNSMDDAKTAANAAFKKVAGTMTNEGAGGGGKSSGGGGENGGTGDGYGGGYGFDPNKMLGKNSKLKGNGVAGMSKKLGSDNIGVAGDNIFEMISRRYQVRDKANNFIVDQK